MDAKEFIHKTVSENPVVLFMKGTAQFPQCGFSGRAIPLLDDDGQPAGFAAGLRCVDDFVEEQERAQRSEREVAMVLDGMLDPHMLLGAVRDDSGEVVDVTFLRLNPEACRVLMVRAEGLIGRNLLAWQPGMVTTGIWQAGLRLWSTGEPMVLDDYQFPGEVLPGEHYFDIRGVRLGDDLLSCAFRDVTNRHRVNICTMGPEGRVTEIRAPGAEACWWPT